MRHWLEWECGVGLGWDGFGVNVGSGIVLAFIGSGDVLHVRGSAPIEIGTEDCGSAGATANLVYGFFFLFSFMGS